MDHSFFHELCHEASHLAVRQPGHIGNLVLTTNHRDESPIREPEMLHAFGRTLDAQGGRYGIEVPTVGLYRFTKTEGKKTRRARHDLVLFKNRERDVLIELKKGQPGGKDSPAIGKDLQKLVREKASGKCMFHICDTAEEPTVPAVIKKYNAALADTLTKVAGHDLRHNGESWFALYILVLIDREKKRPLLLSYRAPTLAGFLADPVFHLERFKVEHVPRD
jgi:hypothetical protein